MDMTTNTTGTTTPELIPLLWLASPALPVGGFSYSEGLEGAVDEGLVADETQAAQWLAQQLHLTLARADLVVVRDAMRAWRDNDLESVRELNAWMLRTRETSELRQQTVQMGRSFVEWLKAVRPQALFPALSPAVSQRETELVYPVAWALAAASFGIEARSALHAFAFGWAENMVQAAVRVVPLGQSAGQRILSRLAHEIPSAVDHAMAREKPQSFAPMLAILSSRHENQYSRLFRS